MIVEFHKTESVGLAYGAGTGAVGIGNKYFLVKNKEYKLTDMLYVQNLQHNLFSLWQGVKKESAFRMKNVSYWKITEKWILT